MAVLPWAQQELLESLEAGGKLVEDEQRNPWLEDAHGGRRRLRKPTLEALRKKGFLDQYALELPKIRVSRAANELFWFEWLRGNFGEDFSKMNARQKKDHLTRCSIQIVAAIEKQVQSVRSVKGLLLEKEKV